MISAPLQQVLDEPKILIPAGVTDLPVSFEVVHMVELASRFRGSRTFVEEAEKAFPDFYAKVAQRLIRWMPKPPKLKEPKPEAVDEESPVRSDIGGLDIPVLSTDAAAAGPAQAPDTLRAETTKRAIGDDGET